MDEVSANVFPVEVVLKKRHNLHRSSQPEREIWKQGCEYLECAHVYPAVYKVVANLQLGIFFEHLSGYARVLPHREAGNRLVVYALRGVRIDNKYRRVTPGSEMREK